MRKSLKKRTKMASKFYTKSTENQHQKRDAKMTPKCSKTYPKRRPKIDKMSTKSRYRKQWKKHKVHGQKISPAWTISKGPKPPGNLIRATPPTHAAETQQQTQRSNIHHFANERKQPNSKL